MNMVKSEFYKLKKSGPFQVCLSVCVFMAALLPFTLSRAAAGGEPDVQALSLSAVEITSYAFSMPILTLVAAVFTSVFVSGEFTHGTMKNYVSKGFNRTKLFGAKFLACAVAVTLMMVVFVPVILLSGTIFLGLYCGFYRNRNDASQQRGIHRRQYLPCQYLPAPAFRSGLYLQKNWISNLHRMDRRQSLRCSNINACIRRITHRCPCRLRVASAWGYRRDRDVPPSGY